MADLRSALFDHLNAGDDETREALVAALDGIDLAAARLEAKNDPASVDATAKVLGRLIVDDAPQTELVDAAKALAQRAPRDGGGNAVALLAGTVIWRHTQDAKKAEPYFRRVRRSEPGDAQVLAFYRALFADEASATQLMQVLMQAQRGASDPEQRFALAQERAALAEERLGSADRAIEVWRSVMREDGYDRRASEALERLYRDAGKWTALVDLLKEELDRIEGGEEANEARIAKLLEIAELYRDRLNLDTMALATLQRILDIDPRHEPSLQALADTYATAGRFNDLLGVYSRRIDAARAAGDAERQRELLLKVAEIWLEKLGNPQRALEPLGQVLELSPGDEGARVLLARIHEQRRDWRALIALRREELAERSGEEALALRIELARLAEERLGDRREAIAAWNEVLLHHGDDPTALDALARLYERESRWASAAEILHRRLAYVDREFAIRILAHLGHLYSDRLQSREDASAAWAELLRLSPGHDKATRRLRDAYVAAGRWDELTALYESQGRLSDVVEVLHSAADRIGDIEERVALYRRVAALCQERLGQPERALKALERTLAIQPDNLAVARELLPIYREQKNWARLMNTYQVLLRAAQGDDERLELIAAMQQVAEHNLSSPTLTLHWAAEAYRIRPGDEALRAALELAAEKADGWDELTTIFEERIAAEGVGDAERLTLLDKLAVIARDKLFKPDDAQRYFRRIIDLDPTNSGAMAALESIYSATRRWDDLSEVYRRRLEVTEDPDARLGTLRRLASILEQHLGDLDGATETYRRILEQAPEDDPSLESLARIHRNRGQWPELAEILERQLARAQTETARVRLMFELAQIRAVRLQQSMPAVEGFLAVLELEPGHRDAVQALEDLRQADPGVSLPVSRGLLPYYRRVEDRQREAEAMEVIIAAEQDPVVRKQLLEQLAAIYERMEERRADSLRIRVELFLADPSHWQGRQTLQRLGAELQRMVDVSEAYESALRSMAQQAEQAEAEGRTLPRELATLRRDLLLEHAAMLRDALARPHDAERAYAIVLEQDETHQGAYEALEALLRGREASSELVALYRRRVDVTFNQREQKELLSRMTEISRHVLGDRAAAIATAEELLDLIPDDLPTIELLADLYGEGEEPSDRESLEEILGRWAELTSDASLRRRLMVRRAALRMQFLGDAFGAVDLLGQVLGEDPDDAQARHLLEELLDISEVQLPACALLEPIYQRLGDHEGRIRILHVRRAHAEEIGSVDEAVTHLIEIARLREQEQDDPSSAFGSMREAFGMDVRRRDTREQVERLGLALRRPADLVEVWRGALASDSLDRALQIDFTHRIAVLLDEHLHDQEAARHAYGELLALDPPDATLAHRAVEALCRLHLEAGDGVALIEAKRALLRFVDSDVEQVRIRLQIAGIQEELGDRVGAALTYSEVLDMAPDDRRSLEALERLFQEEGEWERLCEVLEHRIGVTTESRLRAPIWRQIGEIQRDHLSDAHRAISAFQSVLDLKVGREDTAYALSSLVELNQQLERWPDVEDGLRRLTALADNDGDRVQLLARTADVVGQRLGRGEDALELLKRVLDLAPTDERAREAVEQYLDDDDTRDRAMRILMPIYEGEQNWPALLRLEELQARKQPSGRRRLQALLRVATTQEERIGDPERAFGVLCEAMAEAADQPELSEILDKVERLGAEDARAEALLSAYGQTVDHILDSDLQQRVLRAMGEVALHRLEQLDAARGAYERVLELAPGDAGATGALESIYLRQEDYEPLAQLLVAQADRAEEGEPRDELLLRAAELYRINLERPEDAIRLYERLSSPALERPDVQEVLEPLYEATGRYRELAAHLNRKLGRLQGHDAVDTHLRLGRLYGEKLDDPEEGIRHLSTALRLDPDHAVGTEELGRYLEDPTMRGRVAEMLEPVFAAVADWSRLIQIQEIRLQEAGDEHERMRLLLRIAQIEEEQLEDLDKAFESYTRLFKEQPRERRVRDQLARLAGVLSRVDLYAEALTEYVSGEGADDDGDDTLDVVREAAELWSGSLRQPERAVPLLQRLLEARPDDSSIFPSLESALTQAELWRELGAAYWREVDNALEESRQIEILRKLATLSQEMLEDAAEAGRAYQRILEIQPEYELARSRLEQIYEETKRWPELVELLRDRLDRTEDTVSRATIHTRIADVQDQHIDDPDAAVDTLEAMLAELPDDPEAVLRLERIAEARRGLRPRILSMLRPIYERQGNLRRIVDIDEWQLLHVDDPIVRHELYREISSLLLRAPETHSASFNALCRALAEPGPEDALRGLDAEVARVAEALDLGMELSDALVAAAGGDKLQSDVDRRLALMVWAARIQHGAGEPGRAVEILRAALELSPEHEPTLTLLDTCLQQLGFHEELREVLVVRARVANEDAERLELMRRLATLLEDVLARSEEAEVAWRELLDIEPSDREALQRLARAYENRGAVHELIEVLRRQVETSEDPQERRDLRMKLADLHREAREDRAAEIDVLRELLIEAEGDTEALAALSEALVAEERDGEATEVLAERARLTEEPYERALLVLSAARLFVGPLEDVPSALERYEEVLSIVPGQEGALEDLVKLAQTEDHFEAASNLVMPQLDAAGYFADLATVLASRAQLTQDPEDKAQSLRRLAQVRLERLEDPAGALASLGTLVDVVEPAELPEVLEAAGRLAVQLGGANEHVDELAGRAAQPDRDPEARVVLASQAARLAEDILGDNERALALLLPLLDEALATAVICAEIERLGRAVGNGEAIERGLREAVRLAEDDGERAALMVRHGEAQLALGDRSGALESYRDAFEQGAGAAAIAGLEQVLASTEGPAPDALLDALDAAYVATENRAGQARVVVHRLQQAEEGSRLSLLEQLGSLYDAGGGTPPQALEAWGALLAVDPESATGLERVLALGREQGLLAQAVELMLAAIEAGRAEGRLTAPLALQTATVLLRELGDGGRALVVLDAVLEDNAEHPEALERRVEAARAVGDAPVLHDALTRLAAVQPGPDAAAALWYEAAGVAETALVDLAVAIADLEQVISLDEGHADGWGKLLALLSATGDHERLADALSRRALIVEDSDERRELRHRLATVLVEALDRPDDAITTYQDMVADKPDDLVALRELEALLRRLERWDDVRDTLERRLEVALEAADRVTVLMDLAEVAEQRLGDTGEAIERLQQVLLEQAGHPAAEDALDRLLSAEERYVDLSELLQARMDRARESGDADRYRLVASRLAALLAEKLDDSERAESILQQLLELDPAYVPALLALASVYDARGDDDGMREILERAAALDPQGSEGAALQLRLAELAIDDPARRRQHLERAYGLAPAEDRVVEALTELSRSEERWDQVAQLLEGKAEREAEPAARRALKLERVDLLMSQLHEIDAALVVLYGLYEEDQEDVEINRRVADGLFMADRFDEAKGIYAWLVEVTRRGKRDKILGHYLTRLARIGLREGDAAGAREQLLEAYRIDTTNVETLVTLGGLHEQNQAWKDALKIYRTMLLQNADRSGLLRRGDIYANLARAHLALNEAPKAKAMLRRGLEEDPEHPDLAAQLEALG
ncbi:MAG: tetratricopeptide repeat protein [Myxococcales bacterium]|nr:tetratricopeptide repeat protein [Myxococcales bacterium]